jgi:hypothetical protein
LAGAPPALAVDTGTAPAARGFATPEEAVAALVTAARADDTAAMRSVLGPGSDALVQSGDKVADAQAWRRFVTAYDARHVLAPGALGRMVLTVGGDDGIMSFEVNQEGVVFQKDLGPTTATLASEVRLFDPDLSWTRIDVVGQ